MADRTVAIYPSGASAPGGYDATYTTMSAFEAAEGGDLVSSTTTLTCEITASDGNWNTADSTSVSFAGWTTNATYDVTITALDDGARNTYSNGQYSTSSYRLEIDASSTRIIYILNPTNRFDLTIDGVQLVPLLS